MSLLTPAASATGHLTVGTNTVRVANLKLGAAQVWSLFNPTTTSSTSTFSVSSNIDLNGQSLTISPNRNSASGNNGIVNLSGNITGCTGCGDGLKFTSNGTFRNSVNLTGANAYTGKTTSFSPPPVRPIGSFRGLPQKANY